MLAKRIGKSPLHRMLFILISGPKFVIPASQEMAAPSYDGVTTSRRSRETPDLLWHW